MNDKDPGPVDTPIDRIREALAEIPGSSVIADALTNATVTGMAAIPAGPLGIAASLAGAFTTWHGGRRTAVILDRLQRVLWLMVEEIARMQAQGVPVTWREEAFLEFVETVVPFALRTRSEEKRRRFALLTAHAAADNSPEDMDEAQTMALLLQQLEEGHIVLLQRVIDAAFDKPEVHARLGVVRYAPLERVGYMPELEGAAWIRLHSLGLLSGADGSTAGLAVQIGEPESRKAVKAVAVTPLGLALHQWISEYE